MRKQKFSFLGDNFGDLSPSGNAFDIHAFTQPTIQEIQTISGRNSKMSPSRNAFDIHVFNQPTMSSYQINHPFL